MQVVVDDLALRASEAIVRPATARLDATTPAVRRLETVAGVGFRDSLRLQRDLAVGAAVVTGGGELPAEFVIHAVIQSDKETVSRAGVARAWLSVLQRAQEWQFTRVTAPPLGIGAGNLTVEDAAEIMVTVVKAHREMAAFPVDVCFVVETPEDRDVFDAALKRAAASES